MHNGASSLPDLPGFPTASSYVSVEDERGARLLVHPGYESILRNHGLCGFEHLFATPGDSRMDKKGLAPWRQRLRLTLTDGADRQRFYLKRYDLPPTAARLRRLWSRGEFTADAEWRALHLLAELGFRVPTPVAYGGVSRGRGPQRSLLLTAEVPGESLERWLPVAAALGQLDRRCRLRLIARLAALISALHRNGLVHRDLYLAHVFVDHPTDGDCELSLIDLQRVKSPKWRLHRWIVKDLASLNYSATPEVAGRADRLRFMKQYLGRARLTSRDRTLLRAIATKTRRIARHSLKHGLG